MTGDNDEVGLFRDADLVRLARGVIESYHYDTDFLSELVQNAVDAIRETKRDRENVISVCYNSSKGMYSIKDNGIGMSKKDLRKFALGQTGKSDLSALLIGEKGVGGSYVLMISDFFEVESVKDGKRIVARCVGSRDALGENKEPILKVIEEGDAPEVPNYTRITTKSYEFKNYAKIEDLVHDLRLFTAIGNTKSPFNLEKMNVEVSVSLTTKDDEGNDVTVTKPVEFSILHPAVTSDIETISFEELKANADGHGGKVDLPAGIYRDKIFVLKDNEKQILAAFGGASLLEKAGIEPTIVLGVKGAPMPVEVKSPTTGYAGYWRNLFIVINRDDVELDIGRKSITRKDVREINEILRDFFNTKIVKFASLFIEPSNAPVKGITDQLKEQAKNKPDLEIEGISYEKIPAAGEELAVVSIFHELIGAKILQGYQTLSESSDSMYDGIVRCRIPLESLGKTSREQVANAMRKIKEKPTHYIVDGFIEYKVDAVEFISDCEKGKKHVEDVMLVVAYDFTRKGLRKGWVVSNITPEEKIFPGTKLKLIHESSGREIPLILLRDFRLEHKDDGKKHT